MLVILFMVGCGINLVAYATSEKSLAQLNLSQCNSMKMINFLTESENGDSMVLVMIIMFYLFILVV